MNLGLGGGLQDEMLKSYIDKIFDKYDTKHDDVLTRD